METTQCDENINSKINGINLPSDNNKNIQPIMKENQNNFHSDNDINMHNTTNDIINKDIVYYLGYSSGDDTENDVSSNNNIKKKQKNFIKSTNDNKIKEYRDTKNKQVINDRKPHFQSSYNSTIDNRNTNFYPKKYPIYVQYNIEKIIPYLITLENIQNTKLTPQECLQYGLLSPLPTRFERITKRLLHKEICSKNPTKNIYTREEVKFHTTIDDCWLISGNKVYDVTEYIVLHPFGVRAILKYAGKDVTDHHKKHPYSAQKIWEKYLIGYTTDSNTISRCTIL